MMKEMMEKWRKRKKEKYKEKGWWRSEENKRKKNIRKEMMEMWRKRKKEKCKERGDLKEKGWNVLPENS